MAPRTTKTETPADGAPPGGETVTPNDKYAFNADARAKAREAAQVTIGEKVFFRRRKSWNVTRSLRELLNEQERCILRGQRYRQELSELPISTTEAKLDKLRTEINKHDDAGDEAAFGIIVLLLRDDDGEHPDTDFLKDELDSEDAGDLAGNLAGGGEVAEGPTQTTEA